MKYIRTKDGIFELIWNVIEKNGKQFIIQKYDGFIYEEEIIAQADTIEGLCDCLVLWKNIYEIKHSTAKAEIDCHAITYGSYKWTNKKYKEAYANTYGAIWCDKGLIYVAKMNEKGELELL